MIQRLKKAICKRFGHKESCRGSYLQTGKGNLEYFCLRCGVVIFSCHAEGIFPQSPRS